MKLSLVICTHNPREDCLAETLASVRGQVLTNPDLAWELLLVDNASTVPLAGRTDLSWHRAGRVIREERLGLTHARLRSYREARGQIILYVDDDNVLAPDYVSGVLAAFAAEDRLGAVGGRVLPRYEAPLPDWFDATGLSLACRDLGNAPLFAAWGNDPATRAYPGCAPIGAGMAIRRDAYSAYVEAASHSPVRLALGRKGTDLASGEDNDMILTLLGQGWQVAYLPQLRIDHIIPAARLSERYLQRYAESSNRTWVIVLGLHGIVPWPPLARWTLPLRRVRAWLRCRPWRGPVERIAWSAARGNLSGRASLAGILQP